MSLSAEETRLRARNLRTLAVLGTLFLLPLLASFWLYYGTGWRPAAHVNHGQLIQPPRPLPALALPRWPGPGGPAAQGQALRGRWSLVYVGDGRCDADCSRSLEVMRVTRLALGEDVSRVAPVFLATGHCCAAALTAHRPALTVLDASGARGAALLRVFPRADRPHSLYVVDPLGNLMMRYDVRRNPRGLLLDLMKLLRLSQIG